MDPRLVLVGLFVGLLVGLTGVGGSSVLTPLLILALGMKPLVAIGTDLAYSVPTKLLGALVHRRQGTVDWQVVSLLSLGGLPASLVGLGVLALLRARLGLDALNVGLKHGVGALLLIVAVAVVLTPLLRRWHADRPNRWPAPRWVGGTRWSTIALGALVGFLVSLTSIGAGSITVPALYLLLPRIGLRRLVGSDVAFAALLIPMTALGHLGMGDVDLKISLNLLLGSLPGVFIGSKLCARLPDIWLRPAMAGALFFAGTRLV